MNTIKTSPNPNSATQPLRLPTDWRVYISEIKDRSESLIHYHIWSGLHVIRLRAWMSNFITDEERYFAACILDFLIYRSEDQTLALIKQLFQRVLPDLSRLDPVPGVAFNNWEYAFKYRSHSEPGVRLVAVVKETDPPTKSSHVIVRLMKRNLGFNEAWIIRPEDIRVALKQGVKSFFFVDDFLGTGDQFEKFVKKQSLQKVINTAYCAYVPLVAHEKGINRLRSNLPKLRVEAVEVLNNSHSVFHQECPCFNDGINTPEVAKEFYYNLLRDRGVQIPGPKRRGYGHLALAFSFSHASPNNALPILWWAKAPNWKPLFDR